MEGLISPYYPGVFDFQVIDIGLAGGKLPGLFTAPGDHGADCAIAKRRVNEANSFTHPRLRFGLL
jgi:hypothetical protein